MVAASGGVVGPAELHGAAGEFVVGCLCQVHPEVSLVGGLAIEVSDDQGDRGRWGGRLHVDRLDDVTDVWSLLGQVRVEVAVLRVEDPAVAGHPVLVRGRELLNRVPAHPIAITCVIDPL